MRILIAGAGRAGLSVAGYLTSAGHQVTVIDRDPLVCARVKDQLGIVALLGDAADSAILTEAEVRHAEAVVAMLHRDADNLAVASLAKLAQVPRVMVRMRDPEYRPVYLAAGVHRILSETEIFIGSLAATASRWRSKSRSPRRVESLAAASARSPRCPSSPDPAYSPGSTPLMAPSKVRAARA